jgi:hypothetical protein
VRADRLGQLPADGQHRVERGHRLLEDHGDAVAADFPHPALAQPGSLHVAEPYGAARKPRARLGQ